GEADAGIGDAPASAALRPVEAAGAEALVGDALRLVVDDRAHLARGAALAGAGIGLALAGEAHLALGAGGAGREAHAGGRVAELARRAGLVEAGIVDAHRRIAVAALAHGAVLGAAGGVLTCAVLADFIGAAHHAGALIDAVGDAL